MLSDAANRDLIPASPTLTTHIEEFVRTMSTLFYVTAPLERDQLSQRHLAALLGTGQRRAARR